MHQTTLHFLTVFLLQIITLQFATCNFAVSPSHITPFKSKSLSLRCTADGSGVGSILAIHIKKKEQVPITTNQSNAENQTAVPSLPVQGRSQRGIGDSFVRATITTSSKITVVPPLTRFLTEGSVTDSPYLMISIQSPDVDSLGLYECQVTHFNDEGDVKVDTEVLEVLQEVELSLETLESRVKNLEAHIPVIKIIAETMSRTVQNANGGNKQLEADMAALKQENRQLNDVITSLTNELRALAAKVDSTSGNQAQRSGPEGNSGFGNSGNDEVSRMKDRLEDLENTRIHVLEEQMETMRSREKNLEDLAVKTEFTINTSIEPRLKQLEKVDFKGLSENLEDIETNVIPAVVGNITETQAHLSQLQGSLSAIISSGINIDSTSPAEEKKDSQAVPQYDGPACYVCGDNSTQQACTIKNIQENHRCRNSHPMCMTDVYQIKNVRRIYKRCVTKEECNGSVSRSDLKCKNDNFMLVKPMECHFCCSSQLCNDSIRPTKDLVNT